MIYKQATRTIFCTAGSLTGRAGLSNWKLLHSMAMRRFSSYRIMHHSSRCMVSLSGPANTPIRATSMCFSCFTHRKRLSPARVKGRLAVWGSSWAPDALSPAPAYRDVLKSAKEGPESLSTRWWRRLPSSRTWTQICRVELIQEVVQVKPHRRY